MTEPRPILTTTQAAKLAGLSVGTLMKFIDGGQIASYRIPGSSHRRIHRESLIAGRGIMRRPTGADGEIAFGRRCPLSSVSCPKMSQNSPGTRAKQRQHNSLQRESSLTRRLLCAPASHAAS